MNEREHVYVPQWAEIEEHFAKGETKAAMVKLKLRLHHEAEDGRKSLLAGRAPRPLAQALTETLTRAALAIRIEG